MCREITNEDPCKVPMRIYPAVHYTMGGLWVDYNLMSNLPGLFVIGEANFSDHGANRLGASALMQGLADGYFILPYTIGDYLARSKRPKPNPDSAEFREAEERTRKGIQRLFEINGKYPVDMFHRQLGKLLWDHCGMSRSEASLRHALEEIPKIRERFWREARVTGGPEGINQALERAGRVADFLEFAELMCLDALERRESCGGHFREEFQTEDGEAKRDDENFCHVAAWEYRGPNERPERHIEPLRFEFVQLTTRSYK